MSSPAPFRGFFISAEVTVAREPLRMALTHERGAAADLLNDRVVPFFEEHGIPLSRVRALQHALLPETVRLLRAIQPLHVTPDMPVFTNIDGRPIEPNSFLKPWYRGLCSLGIRVRSLYATKDTYVSTVLTTYAGSKVPWLEAQTGVRYETLRRHYGKWIRGGEGSALEELDLLARLAPSWPPRSGDACNVAISQS